MLFSSGSGIFDGRNKSAVLVLLSKILEPESNLTEAIISQ